MIATDHGGAREILHDGETGWLVPPGNAAALAQAIAAALALTPDERMAMAERAIARMREYFTTQAMTDRTLAVYEEILFPEAVAADPSGPVAA